MVAVAIAKTRWNVTPSLRVAAFSHRNKIGQRDAEGLDCDSRSSRRAKLEDAHYPGSANAARVIAVLAPEALPFEPKLTKVSAPQARLLAARAAKSSKRLRVPTEPAPYLQTTP